MATQTEEKAEVKTTAKAAEKTNKSHPVPRLLRANAERVLEVEYDFMDSEVFAQRGVEKALFEVEDSEKALPFTRWYQPTRDEAFEGEKDMGQPQLMKPAEEKLMFLRFNYAKKKLGVLQRRVKRKGLDKKTATELVEWDRKFEHYREYLVRTNLALVLAMAKRTRLGDVDFAEIVSEGNMALIRAVDKFNVDKGFKFSTYACRAILKAFSRTAMKHSRHRQRFPVEFEPDLEKSNWDEVRRELIEDDCVDELKTIVDENLADLSDVERTVLKRRFNWAQEEDAPLTLEQVGRIIGVTKERVRQIQNKALVKIRARMEDGVLRNRPEPQRPETPAEEPALV
ncbi:MAG: sigma-70 family RNA polymerase sigma factor [Planctomycetota bacterium]